MTRILRSAGAILALLVFPPWISPPSAFPAAAPENDFIRGVWLHPGQFGPDETAAATAMGAVFEAYVRAGIDSVFIMVKSPSGHVYFRSSAGVPDPAYAYDFFGLFLREARRRNLTVHPWFCVFPESAGIGEAGRRPEWLVQGLNGETAGSVNPAIPEARAYERGLMLELLRNYPEADWIHLDYIRYPCEPTEPFYGFDKRSRDLFKAETGADPLELKAKDTGNMMWAEWLRWNSRRVTLFIQELRRETQTLGRTVRISAAVFPDAAASKVLIGQDWAEWARSGWSTCFARCFTPTRWSCSKLTPGRPSPSGRRGAESVSGSGSERRTTGTPPKAWPDRSRSAGRPEPTGSSFFPGTASASRF